MARNETVRLKPKLMADDASAFAALQQMNDYAPANASYEVAKGTALQKAHQDAFDAEAQAEAAYKAARDNAVQAEWNFHNYMLGVKDQVMAQYGKSSNELQSLGLKKKTEYKTPKPKKKQ
jgi:glutathione peroxidase-family protein